MGIGPTGPFGPGIGGLNQGRQILLDRGGYDTGVSVLAVVLRFTVWVLVILAVVWIVREILRVIAAGRHLPPPPPNPALAELEMLYARGEVSRTDFLARRADLGGLAPPVRPAG